MNHKSDKRAFPRINSWPPVACLLCWFMLQLAFVVSTTEFNELTTAPSSARYLPDCTTEEKKSNLFVVSTLDGKISVIDAVDGQLKWSKQFTSGPLLSSSINDFIVNNKGEIVRIVPSLDGNLFVYNGRTIKQTQLSTDKLLKNSIKFSENVLLVGGHENQVIGLNLHDGSVVYECGFKGCSQIDNLTLDNVVLIKKNSQSVRAINALSGKEEWHFTISDPQLDSIANQQCYNNDGNSNSKYTVDYKVIIPSGFIYSSVYYLDNLATKRLHKKWNFKFDSPIVNMWHYNGGKLDQVNLFSRDKIDITSMHIDQSYNADLYIGSYNNQLYIQKSTFYKENNYQTIEENAVSDHLSEKNTAIIQVEWKQPSAQIGNIENVTEKFAITPKSAFPVMTFNKVNSTGYYIFKLNTSESGKCERISDNKTIIIDDTTIDNLVKEVIIVSTSLSYYWKEIIIICLLSWIGLNFLALAFKYFCLPHVIRLYKYYFPSIENNENHTEDKCETNAVDCKEENGEFNYKSRYFEDFEPIRLLGKGGYGMVFESKHKIDESHYAVKRISIPSQKEKRKRFMREIMALSKLNHNGIVRYYNAWIEEPPVGWQETQDKMHNFNHTEGFTEGFSLTENVDSLLSEGNISCSQLTQALQQSYVSNNSLEIVFQDNTDLTRDENSRSHFSASNHGDTVSITKSGSSAQTNQIVVDGSTQAHNKQSTRLYIYIQMQLCKKETLKDWLFEHPERDKYEMLRIFTQILDAVHYVHSNKLIHRDLKPSNIFFSMDGLVKIGDFGLVTNTLDHYPETDAEEPKALFHKHTNDVGTQLYMSPEQISNKQYDHKVDIFSMGIILFELLASFTTECERIQTLNGVRKKKFPKEFIENHPKESQVLQKLLSFDPKERPEAHELLRGHFCLENK